MIEQDSESAVTQLFQCRRLGVVMAPDLSDPREAWGVLNPAGARDASGALHLFPRLVAESNYSRIGHNIVEFDAAGNPQSVKRQDVALAPERAWEKNPHTGGGVEDPRITYIEPLKQYVMTYTAFGRMGPRVALAISSNLYHWKRLGLVQFRAEKALGTNLNHSDNKDAVFFPVPVCDPSGKPALALMHRPAYTVTQRDGTFVSEIPHGVPDPRPSVWFSYVPLDRLQRKGASTLIQVEQHECVMTPKFSWESAKVGMGTQPVRTPLGWLTLYHGVEEVPIERDGAQVIKRSYRAGVAIFDLDDPRKIVYRSPEPIMAPSNADEVEGIVGNVVFPTALDARDNGRFDFYYGMADTRIGAATFQLPATLPTNA